MGQVAHSLQLTHPPPLTTINIYLYISIKHKLRVDLLFVSKELDFYLR